MAGKPWGRNEYRVEGDVAIITLTQGKEAIIDVVDLEKVLLFRWHAVCTDKRHRPDYFYASTTGPVYLHRFIATAMGSSDAPYVDHINGDGLDCRRENLRWATNQENSDNRPHLDVRNTSGHRGVSRHKASNGKEYWIAKVSRTLYFPGDDGGFQAAVEEHQRLYQLVHSYKSAGTKT